MTDGSNTGFADQSRNLACFWIVSVKGLITSVNMVIPPRWTSS